MKKYSGYIFAVLSVLVAVIGIIVLPDTVVSKISSSGNTTMSKYPAMLVPAALTVVFGCMGSKSQNSKYLVAALILLLAALAMLILNLTVFA